MGKVDQAGLGWIGVGTGAGLGGSGIQGNWVLSWVHVPPVAVKISVSKTMSVVEKKSKK